MNLDKFITSNELIQIRLDDDEIKQRYGDEIVFYTHSHPKLNIYFKFFESRLQGDYETLEDIMRSLILNDQGKELIQKDQTLPADIFTAAILKIGDLLGKSVSKISHQDPGEQHQ